MSDSIQTALYIAAETTYGDGAATTVATLRQTNNTIKLTRSAHPSQEIRADRNLADHRLGVHTVEGDISTELVFEGDGSAFDILLRSLFLNAAFEPGELTATDISAASSDNSLNTAGGVMPAAEPGDTILIVGFTGNTSNNGRATVVSRTNNKIVITGKTLVTDAAGEEVTIINLVRIYTPGVTSDRPDPSFMLVRRFPDASIDPDQLVKGCNVSSMNFKASADGLVSCSTTIMGQDMVSDDLTLTVNDPSTTRPMDSYTGSLTIDGTANAQTTEIDFTISNSLSPRFVIGSKLTQNHTVGQVLVTGSMTSFFGETDWFNDGLLDEQTFNIVHTFKDPAGNKYSFRFPKVYITAATNDTQGINGEVTMPLTFAAVYDSTAGFAVQLRWNPALS